MQLDEGNNQSSCFRGKTKKGGDWAMSKEKRSMDIPWRKNVLSLVIAGYVTLLLIFGAMVWKGGMNADDAYEVVKGPLMALIGGSLAISKDLIPLGISLDEREVHSNRDDQRRQGK